LEAANKPTLVMQVQAETHTVDNKQARAAAEASNKQQKHMAVQKVGARE